jgi:hypothetical protein
MKKKTQSSKDIRDKEIINRNADRLNREAIDVLNYEDALDLAAFEERKNEPLISWDEMMERLKKAGKI